MVDENNLSIEEKVFDKKKGFVGEVCYSQVEADLSIFSEIEKSCLKRGFYFFKDFSATKISDYSHEELGYKNTSNLDQISYEWAKELKLDLE